MRGYFGLNQMSPDEKSDILSQHKSLYNGYQTMQPKVSNTQPLHVFDARGDKDGVVINNKGEVKKYTNFGINESQENKEVCDECGSMIMDGVCECNYGHMEEGKQTCDECGGRMYEGVCNECGYGHMEEHKEDGDPQYHHIYDPHAEENINEEICECGGEMYEGVCNECGYGHMEEETGHLDDIYNVRDLNLKKGDFDYVEGGGNDYGTFEGMHKKLYKEQENDFQDYESSYTKDGVEDPDNEDDGFEDLNLSEIMYEIDDDSELDEQGYTGGGNAPDMDLSNIEAGYDFESDGPEQFKKSSRKFDVEDEDEEDELPAYDFESGGPNDVYPVFEDDMYGYDPEKMYETMESAWAEEEMDEEMDEQTDISGVQGVYGDMKKPYDFDSNGPGIAGPYQHSSWGGGSTHSPKREEEFEEVDEDLKESFLQQKNKINEMFNRFKKYN
jgi:hypothetical protein